MQTEAKHTPGLLFESCICCANGNDLPDGEECMACGREGRLPLSVRDKNEMKPSARDQRLIEELCLPPIASRSRF